MRIRKITFDNGDIFLAKDQAILYNLLLKQQTKTILPNGETIYQNSTGFLSQNESEKLKYIYKTNVNGLEFIFNSQLYLSVCGRIIKLEKDTKYLFDWNDIENNENYYMVIRVDLNKEAKIINGELKEFGNPIEIKIINTVSRLIQDNLNQKPNDGIYEFPLISFKTKFKKDIYDLETIENIKDESTYLLPLLMESTHNPSKPLTITQKIQEEKELLQEKQNQLKNIKNYLTNLEYRKMEELKKLEEYIIEYQLKNIKQVYPSEKPFNTVDNKWYFVVWKPNNTNLWKISKFQNNTNNGKEIEIWDPTKPYDTSIYLWVFETKEQDLLIIDYSEAAKRLFWSKNNGKNFKAVYRWNDDKNIPNLVIDYKTGELKKVE